MHVSLLRAHAVLQLRAVPAQGTTACDRTQHKMKLITLLATAIAVAAAPKQTVQWTPGFCELMKKTARTPGMLSDDLSPHTTGDAQHWYAARPTKALRLHSYGLDAHCR